MSDIRYWIRRFLRQWKLDEPAYCRNCGSLSFTKWFEDGLYPRWTCEECEHVHAVTFGGTWRVGPPVEEA